MKTILKIAQEHEMAICYDRATQRAEYRKAFDTTPRDADYVVYPRHTDLYTAQQARQQLRNVEKILSNNPWPVDHELWHLACRHTTKKVMAFDDKISQAHFN